MSTTLPSDRATRLAPLTLTLLRVVTGALLMQHGVQKLFGWLSDPPGSWTGTPPFGSLMWVAGVLETFGGLLVVVGLFTRPTAFLLAGTMAVAYFKVHVPQGFFPALNGGEEAALFCFVFLHLFAVGAGPFSVDAAWQRRRSAPVLAAARLALVAAIAGTAASLGASAAIAPALGSPADADGARPGAHR